MNQKPDPKLTRASRRTALISIDLAEKALCDRMTEQCKDGERYLTVYRGTRAELIAAGMPEAAFPRHGIRAEFRACAPLMPVARAAARY
jgi:hypothetical protein